MNKKFFIIILSTVLILSTIVTLYFIVYHPQKRPHFNSIHAQLTNPSRLQGTITPTERYTLFLDSRYGQLDKILVNNSDTITKDTPLIRYYNQTVAARIDSLNQLSQQRLSPEQSFQLTYQLADLKPQLYTDIKSPIAGRIFLYPNVADHHGATILDVISKTQHIVFNVPENLYHHFKPKQKIQLIQQTNRQPLEGSIISIAPQPNPSQDKSKLSNYTMTVKANKTFPIGTHFDLLIETPKIILPNDVLLNENTVLVYKQNKFIERRIQYEQIDGQLLIKKGIFDGEIIVRNPKSTGHKAS